MNVICPKCGEQIAVLESLQPLNAQFHCPFDGHDFGVSVTHPEGTKPAPVLPLSDAPTAG